VKEGPGGRFYWRKRGIRLFEATFAVFFVLLFFQSELQNKIGFLFGYLDEIAALFLLAWAISIVASHRLSAFHDVDKKGIVFLMLVCVAGLLGNALYGLQPEFFAVAVDLLTCTKFFVAFWSLAVLASYYDLRGAYRACVFLSKAFVSVLFVLMLINQVVDIGMSIGSRFGIKCFLFLSAHTSNFAASIVCALALLMGDARRNRWYILLALLLLCSTMRFKAIGFAVVVAIELLFFRDRTRLTAGFVFVAIFAASFAAVGQIDAYYLDENTARSVLSRQSLTVANWFFPLGSGFASYGSFVTLAHYVDLYDALGFGEIYGLTRADPSYLADSFWPIVIGQFGFIGSALFVALVVAFLQSILKRQREKGSYFWAALAIPTYLLIASTSEPAFFNAYAVSLALALALVLFGSIRQGKER